MVETQLHPDNASMAIECLQNDLAAKDGEISTLRADNEQLCVRLAGAQAELVEWKVQAGKYSAGCEMCAPIEAALRELLRVITTPGVGWGPAIDAAKVALSGENGT